MQRYKIIKKCNFLKIFWLKYLFYVKFSENQNKLLTKIPFLNAFQRFFLFGIFLAIMNSINLNHL